MHEKTEGNEQMKQRIEVKIDKRIVELLNAEAERQNLTRAALLELVLGTFAENIEQQKAEDILSIPLQSVTRQLNTLTETQNHNAQVNQQDMQELVEAVKDFSAHLQLIESILKRG